MQSGDDAAHVRRFQREAEILARLHHPNTVRVLDTGQSADRTLYLVMEHVQGHSLEATLRRRLDDGEVLSEADATAIGLQVLGSLAEAHALGLVHRDVKPANIMLDDQEGAVRAKVLDFGIAQTQESSLTATGKLMGTPTYMSPEQCLGLELDGRSDLYALGAVLYRCVSGRAPFEDPNALTVMFNHVNVPPRDLASVAQTTLSAGFVDVVMRALAKAPDERFADAQAMGRALSLVKAMPLGGTRSVETRTASPLRLQPVAPLAGTSMTAARVRDKWLELRTRALPWVLVVASLAVLVVSRITPDVPESRAAPPLLVPVLRTITAPVLRSIAAPVLRTIAAPAPRPIAPVMPAVAQPAPPAVAPTTPAPPAAVRQPVAAAHPVGGHRGRSARLHPRRAAATDDPNTVLPPDAPGGP